MKRKIVSLLAVLAMFSMAVPAQAATVNRAVIDQLGPSGVVPGYLAVGTHFWRDDNTEALYYNIDVNAFNATDTTGYNTAVSNAISAFAVTQGYTLSSGIIFPYSTTGGVTVNPVTTQFVFGTSTRSLNTPYRISSTSPSFVSASVDVTASLTLVTGQSGSVTLEYADDSGFTTNVKTVQPSTNGNTGTLAIGLALGQTVTATVTGWIPAGKYIRIRTTNITGTPTFTLQGVQEVAIVQ